MAKNTISAAPRALLDRIETTGFDYANVHMKGNGLAATLAADIKPLTGAALEAAETAARRGYMMQALYGKSDAASRSKVSAMLAAGKSKMTANELKAYGAANTMLSRARGINLAGGLERINAERREKAKAAKDQAKVAAEAPKPPVTVVPDAPKAKHVAPVMLPVDFWNNISDAMAALLNTANERGEGVVGKGAFAFVKRVHGEWQTIRATLEVAEAKAVKVSTAKPRKSRGK